MRRRKRISRKRSKKLFSKTAKRVHKKNLGHRAMRGGIRL